MRESTELKSIYLQYSSTLYVSALRGAERRHIMTRAEAMASFVDIVLLLNLFL